MQTSVHIQEPSTKQINRCLTRLHDPILQGLLLKGYKCVWLPFTPQTLRLQADGQRGVLIGTYFGLKSDHSNTYGPSGVFERRASAAKILKALRKSSLKPVSAEDLNVGAIYQDTYIVGKLPNLQAIEQRYLKLREESRNKTKTKRKKHSQSDLLNNLATELKPRENYWGSEVVFVKAGKRTAKKLTEALKLEEKGIHTFNLILENGNYYTEQLNTENKQYDKDAIEKILIKEAKKEARLYRTKIVTDKIVFIKTKKDADLFAKQIIKAVGKERYYSSASYSNPGIYRIWL